ncbi:hypothetical protein LPJ78_003304 [Coemansia sp. RSA 989]|nr:hypothetical protein BX667DRAFT_513947 [Coemansia mojavensis]KAJ1738339.1 hypothetical protein LPJ68_005636 [Coemansia sp. RSA 1086]KAJ1864568.1 hypothetical protein LPJ78_003304 [Coemansia sp. RSA 989]KAJ1868917.1 hypothetical protein LPJ55_005698 [Coemansia sp. RSA 990]KAJ2649071.1 hypothetical protein IWW40_003482 [Coemansia sp. RSA 1250]KAJ2671720.1 hypothetical protein IWW42_003179 [Coemansia sp. RSA 1085]
MSPVEGIPEVLSSFSDEITQKVVSQVKHYLSDANLNHDTYMRKTIEENDGWVPVAALARFNRLRQLMELPFDDKKQTSKKKQALPPVPQHMVRLLGSSIKKAIGEDDEVEVKEDASAIRRKVAYVPTEDWFERTVHFKGLDYGVEWADLIDDLTAYFNEAIEGDNVLLVRLRRNPRTKQFKGNVLVEFKTPEQAESASKREDLEFKGKKLEPAMLPAYHDTKLAADEFIQPEMRKPGASYPTYEEWCVAHGRQPKPEKRKAEEPAEEPVDPKSLVRFTGVEGNPSIKEIKEALGQLGKVRFVEYESEASEGIARFDSAIAEELEKHAEGVKLNEATLQLAAVDEDTANAFFERAKAAADNARGKKRPGRGGRGRGGRNKRSRF